MIRKDITQKYATISKLIASHKTEYIGICNDNKTYYIHKRNEIYDFVNPMSSYVSARIVDGVLCILL